MDEDRNSDESNQPLNVLDILPHSPRRIQFDKIPKISCRDAVLKPGGDVITLIDAKLADLSRQLAETDDPEKIRTTMEAIRLLRRFRKNELSARRLRLRHLQDMSKSPSRKSKLNVDQIANQFSSSVLIQALEKQARKNPNLTSKKLAIASLIEDASTLAQALNDQEKAQLVESLAAGITELARSVVTHFDRAKSTGVDSQQPQQSGPIHLFNIAGRMIDPTKPYAVQ